MCPPFSIRIVRSQLSRTSSEESWPHPSSIHIIHILPKSQVTQVPWLLGLLEPRHLHVKALSHAAFSFGLCGQARLCSGTVLARRTHGLEQGSWRYMVVSYNRGTTKWMVYDGKPYQNGWFGGTLILGNLHMGIDGDVAGISIYLSIYLSINQSIQTIYLYVYIYIHHINTVQLEWDTYE